MCDKEKIRFMQQWKQTSYKRDLTIEQWLDMGLDVESPLLTNLFAATEEYDQAVAGLVLGTLTPPEWVLDMLMDFRLTHKYGKIPMKCYLNDEEILITNEEELLSFILSITKEEIKHDG